MKIGVPHIVRGESSKLISLIEDEVVGYQTEIFFSVPYEYEEYLVDEVADPFILASIPQALVTHQDIVCESMSDVLYENYKSLIYLLSKVYKCAPIDIHPQHIQHLDFSPKEIGTGFSGGIDSFSTFYNHYNADVPETLKISVLALFNVGAYGNDYAKTKACFDADKHRAASFAQEVNLPLLFLDSNISSICKHPSLLGFAQRSILAIASAVLSLQKLFKVYYISSSYTIDKNVYYKADQSKYENIITPLLSNITRLCISETYLNRVEKTRLLMNDKYCQQYLYVCAADIYNEKYNTGYQKGDFPNCGECLKCQRTLVTLDFLGVLDKYDKCFDLEKYEHSRKAIYKDVYLKAKYDTFKKEILDLMLEKGFHIPFIWKLQSCFKSFKYRLYKLNILKRF